MRDRDNVHDRAVVVEAEADLDLVALLRNLVGLEKLVWERLLADLSYHVDSHHFLFANAAPQTLV